MPNPMVTPARWAAFQILQKIETEGAFSSRLLPVYEEPFNSADRGLCHEMVMGVLRRRTFLDAIVEQFSDKSLQKMDLPVLQALRIAVYQLRFLDKIPASAAINEAVKTVQAARLRSAGGFVNAILRKISINKEFDPLLGVTDPVKKLAIETSHPELLIRRWQAQFGAEEAAKLARENNIAPQTSFWIPGAYQPRVIKLLQDRDIVYQPSKFVKGSFILEGSAGAINDLAQDGLIYIQDEGSQLVASAVDMTKESAFLDACAAPGGKTLFQREKTAGFAAKFFAGDHQPHRVASLKRNLSKYGANDVNIVAYDAGKALPFADETFDSVLVDAPCSGTGTIRQNPEIRWNLREGDFARLAQKQKAILTNSASVIRPGGVLIYSTCSLETEENEEVIESFLNSDRNFQIQPPNVLKQFITQRGFARTFPHRDQMGGFFIAALKRAK